MQSKQDIIIQLRLKQKTQGLNKVTVLPVGDKYQVKMNGKRVFPPANKIQAFRQLKQLKLDAKQHDKTGTVLNK